jgi:phosphoglycolate phosphatase-like HAD superfamily hydrolase
VRAVALDLDAVLGDTRPLWRAWLDDASRRFRMGELGALPEDRVAAAAELDRLLPSWRTLLERFAEDNAPVHLRRRNAATNGVLRRLRAEDVRVGAFTDAPEPLARVAAAQLGAPLAALTSGERALERLLAELGADAVVVRSVEDLVA